MEDFFETHDLDDYQEFEAREAWLDMRNEGRDEDDEDDEEVPEYEEEFRREQAQHDRAEERLFMGGFLSLREEREEMFGVGMDQ